MTKDTVIHTLKKSFEIEIANDRSKNINQDDANELLSTAIVTINYEDCHYHRAVKIAYETIANLKALKKRRPSGAF